ncbi:hypothetical protein DFR52_103651 [Hoeflea marina]|uniref:Succinylglutamate desuccinylase/Aspartoacylase catalytic domain-containing protein n=1 Tax=Hoeflea marina TaxID=274592 RepID=A0A317PJH0_9HYPH|nr:succinylglutamate desuccinylase/aspartoacylase family protein [Hoeflea marina]PWW00444.1 hypothetical protein DFR52_103651 [Hoeflea marina]
MHTEIERIAADTPGTSYELVVHRYGGGDPDAPAAYLQAGLHGNERPGVAALHYLMPMLATAEAEGRLVGAVTVVPQANPIAAGQHVLADHLGRFSLSTRVNFNRDYPMPDADGAVPLDAAEAPVFAERRLKSRLLELSDGHRIVLDLHCDDEALQYLYVADELWPALSDLSVCLRADAVIRWHATPDAAFEEAVFARMLQQAGPELGQAGYCVSTVELRGQGDVSPYLARQDADGLYRFLVLRGVIEDDVEPLEELAASHRALPIDHVDVLHAPAGGTLLFHVRPGDLVRSGELLAEILVRPGELGGAVALRAPQDGLVLSRRMRRFIRIGDDVLKLFGDNRSAHAKTGALDN